MSRQSFQALAQTRSIGINFSNVFKEYNVVHANFLDDWEILE